MARVVLLTFMDNDVAERFIEATLDVQEGVKGRWNDLPEIGAMVASGAQVSALVARPTQYCKCPGKPHGWARSPRYGWYICPNEGCHKPYRTVVRDFIQNHLGGCNNLLDELLLARQEAVSDNIPESSPSSVGAGEVLVEETQEAPDEEAAPTPGQGQSPDEIIDVINRTGL